VIVRVAFIKRNNINDIVSLKQRDSSCADKTRGSACI